MNNQSVHKIFPGICHKTGLVARKHFEIPFKILIATSFILFFLSYGANANSIFWIFASHMNGHMESPASQTLSQIPYLCIMTIVMVGPVMLPGIRHTWLNSLYWRRKRATSEYAFGYFACWFLYSFLLMFFIIVLQNFFGTYQILVAFLAASAFWQASSYKQQFIRNCHRSIPLPPKGYAAEVASLKFGLTNGFSCIGTCWLLMASVMLLPHGGIIVIPFISIYMMLERRYEKPAELLYKSGMTFGIFSIIFLIIAAV